MDSYFFDKRKMKKIAIKYGIMVLIMFPILLIVNYLLSLAISDDTLRVFTLAFIGAAILAIMETILYLFRRQKAKKLEKDVVIIKAGTLKKGKTTYKQNLNSTNNNIEKE